MAKEFKERMELVKAMNTLACSLNHEGGYEVWIQTVPDQADDDDLEYIACDDEMMQETVDSFRLIMKHFASDGFYVDKQNF